MTALIFLSSVSHAASGDAGATGEFMNFGVGGRPIGMGKAFTGVSDDVDALYWNPGGLGSFRSGQATFQQTQLVGGAAYQYLGLAQPIYTYGSIAAAVINLSAGDVTRTDSNFVELGKYNNRETGYMLGYGQHLGDHWGVGAMATMEQNVIDDKKATGYGANIGTLYNVNDELSFGAMVRNLVTPEYKFQTDTEKFPRLGRIGASYKFLNGRLLVASDYEKKLSGTGTGDKWYAGVEGKAFENIAIRAGVNTDNVTVGAGVGWKSFVLDYAAQYQQLGFFHQLSIKMFFGGFEVDVSAFPTVFSPVGLKHQTKISILCRNRARIVKWLLSIRSTKTRQVVKSFQGYDSPPDSLEWDGRDSKGETVDPGTYTYGLTVTDNQNRTEKSRIRELKIVSPVPIEIESK